MITIKSLIERAHGQAVKSGWWDSGDRPEQEVLMLIQTEICEAIEDVRARRPLMYYHDGSVLCPGKPLPGVKPEGELVEIADAVIRAGDYLGRVRADWQKVQFHSSPKEIPYDTEIGIDDLVRLADPARHETLEWYFQISACLYEKRMIQFSLTEMLRKTFEMWANRFSGLSLESVIDLKMQFNSTRPYRHGNKAH